MTDQQSTTIRAVLTAAPVAALRRVVRQPLRLWKAGGVIRGNPCRCLMDTIEAAQWIPRGYWRIRFPIGMVGAADAFDAACAADGLRETVGTCKRWAREELEERTR